MSDASSDQSDSSPGTSTSRSHVGMPLAWSVLFGASLMAGYYMLRPLRDEIGASHRDALGTLWTAVFFVMLAVAPLYSALATHLPRRKLIPLVYRFLALNLLIFFGLLAWVIPADASTATESMVTIRKWIEYTFYVWTSMFSLFAVTVFWGFMADLWKTGQAERWFGVVAFGGTAGALLGSRITILVTERELGIDAIHLLVVAAVLLEIPCWCTRRLAREKPAHAEASDLKDDVLRQQGEAVGGSTWLAGVNRILASPYLMLICAYVFLMTFASTFLYFAQSDIVYAAFESRDERRAFLARIDFYVSLATMFLQCLAVGHLVKRLGVGLVLSVLPAVSVIGFVTLALAVWDVPVVDDELEVGTLLLWTFIGFQVVSRVSRYAMAKPAREILFTLVPREARYKSKSFIDTVVYRGGDVANGWIYTSLSALGLTLAGIALVAVPVSAVWIGLAIVLGRRQQEGRARSDPDQDAAI